MPDEVRRDGAESSIREAMATTMPAAAAVAVFGVIYGSLARPELGVVNTILSSALIFSGSVQFAMVGLLLSGGTAAAVLFGTLTLNLRNLVLGAVMRPRLQGGVMDRALRSWFLTDEAVGIAVVVGGDAGRVLVLSGGMLYISWQVGTVLGVVGASVDALGELASAVFPVLFIGLAAAASTSLSVVGRAAVAAAITGLAAWMSAPAAGLIAVAAAVAVAIPEKS